MKSKYLLLIALFLGVALAASGCAGTVASSWPGVTADSGNAYVAGGPYVYAVNLQTGTMVWRFPDKASTANPFYAAPVLTADGQLIVGGFDKKLYSLDPKTGKTNWTFTDARDRYVGGELVSNGIIYAPNSDYNLYALDMTGKLLWSFEADESIWGTPVADGDNVYFGTLGRKVYAVNAQTGKQVWMQSLDGAVLGTPAVGADHILYVGTYGNSLYALNGANGKVLWSKPVSSWVWSGPVLNDGNLYVADANGKLYDFPVSGADAVWTHDLNDAVIGSPLIAGDTLVVSTEKGSVVYLDLNGTPVRTIPMASTIKLYATPLSAGTLILVAPTGAATDPLLIALDQTGTIKWSFIPPK
jgi:outer membrane protein assembly factor BamB